MAVLDGEEVVVVVRHKNAYLYLNRIRELFSSYLLNLPQKHLA